MAAAPAAPVCLTCCLVPAALGLSGLLCTAEQTCNHLHLVVLNAITQWSCCCVCVCVVLNFAAANPEEIEIGDEEEDEEGAEGAAGGAGGGDEEDGGDVQEKAVPAAVFGSLAAQQQQQQAEEEPVGALERFKKRRVE